MRIRKLQYVITILDGGEKIDIIVVISPIIMMQASDYLLIDVEILVVTVKSHVAAVRHEYNVPFE